MEIWDIYDKYRKKKDHTHKRGEDMNAGDYRVVVHVWIVNRMGEFLLQKRQTGKKGWPGMWDCAAAGAAILGDSSRDAVLREAEEEIGLSIGKDDLEPLFTVRFAKGFDDNWLLRSEVNIEELVLQEEEVKEVKWASKEDIVAMVGREEFIPFPFLKRLFEIINSDIRIRKIKLKNRKSFINLANINGEDYYNIFLKEKLIGNILVSDNHSGLIQIQSIKLSEEFDKKEIYKEIIQRMEILYPQAEKIKIYSDGKNDSSIYKEIGYTLLANTKNMDNELLREYIKEEIYRMPDIKDLKNK